MTSKYRKPRVPEHRKPRVPEHRKEEEERREQRKLEKKQGVTESQCVEMKLLKSMINEIIRQSGDERILDSFSLDPCNESEDIGNDKSGMTKSINYIWWTNN